MGRKVIAETHRFCLARRDVVALEDAAGLELRVHRGLVWLTQEGDTRDIVMRAGEAFLLDRRGRATVEGLAAAEISLLNPHPTPQ